MAGRRAGLGVSRRDLDPAGAVGAAAPCGCPGRRGRPWWSWRRWRRPQPWSSIGPAAGEEAALTRVTAALSAERAAKAEAEANLTLARQAVDDYFTKISENALLKRQDAAEVRDLRTLRKELLEVALDLLQSLGRLAARPTRLCARSRRPAPCAGRPDQRRDRLEGGGSGGLSAGPRHPDGPGGDSSRATPPVSASWPPARSRSPSCSSEIGRAAEALAEYARCQAAPGAAGRRQPIRRRDPVGAGSSSQRRRNRVPLARPAQGRSGGL